MKVALPIISLQEIINYKKNLDVEIASLDDSSVKFPLDDNHR